MDKRATLQPPKVFVVIAIVALLGIVLLRNTGVVANEDANIIATMFGALAAAYLGASAAILYQQKKDDSIKIKEEVDSINGTTFTLIRRILWLRMVKEGTIDPFRNTPFRHLDIRPFVGSAPNASLGLEKLNGLLSSGAATVILRLAQEDVAFDSIVNLIRDRNRIHFEFQEQLERAGLRQGDRITHQQLVEKGLERFVLQLVSATDQLVALIDEALSSHLALVDILKRTAMAMHPSMSILAYVELPEPNTKL